MITQLVTKWRKATTGDNAERFGRSPRHNISYLKQAILFTVTVLLPSLALVILSLRIMWQDRELAENRARERREELGLRFGTALSRELEAVTDAALNDNSTSANWTHAEIGVVASVLSGDLSFPWENSPGGPEFARLVREGPFREHLSAGQRWEFAERQYPQALNSYREAISYGQAPAQRAYAQLAAARVLSKLGQPGEAREGLNELLNVPFSTTDEANVPLCLYATGQLLRRNQPEGVDLVLARGAEAAPSFSTAALYMLREHLEHFSALRFEGAPPVDDKVKRVRSIIQSREQWERTRDRLQPLVGPLAGELRHTAASDAKTAWNYDPTSSAFFRVLKLRGYDDPKVVMVNAHRITSRVLDQAGFELFKHEPPGLAAGPRADGVWLGEDFPNLQIALATPMLTTLSARPQSGLYTAVIALVVCITLYGAYLWSRDTRRELKLAQMRSDFVASVSHELKTPLTSVQMLTETIRARDLPPQQRNEYLDLILGESQRLGRLLKNVLDFSQIEQGTRVYQPRPTELRTVLEASERAIWQALREKGIQFFLANNAPGAIVYVDPDALEQAILNLLYNALKYSDHGGRMEMSADHIGAEVGILVRDYGVGIHPRHHQRIFERFYRTAEDHNRRIPGTGLGLALVKHIVESHGGRITLESSPGAGSAFTLVLPLHRSS